MANKYLITGGGNWSGSSWNTASNQATSNTTAPTLSDTAYLDAYSGQCTIDTTTCTCNNLVCTGYVNTLTITSGQILNVTTTLTLASGMTIAGTGRLRKNNGAGTITSAGKIIPELEITEGTQTLADAMRVSGILYQTSASSAGVTLNGSTLRLDGGVSAQGKISGTTSCTITGGTLSTTGTDGTWGLTTSYAGNITIGDWGFTAKTQTYTSGTISVTAGSKCYMNSGSGSALVFNFNANIRLKDVYLISSFYSTLTNPLYIDGDFYWPTTGGIFSIVSGYINLAGSLKQLGPVTVTGSFFVTSGYLVMTGTGSVCTYNSYGQLQINTSGTITFPSTEIFQVLYSSAARNCIIYTAGTVVVETGHKFRINSDATYVNSGAIVWDTLMLGISSTTSTIHVNGNLKCNNLDVSSFREGNATSNLHLDYYTGSLTVRIYDAKTLTVYNSIKGYRGINTYTIRANSGTGTIDYQGTQANMDITNCIFGGTSQSLVATNKLFSFGGSTSFCKNIAIYNPCDLNNGGIITNSI